MKQKLLRNNWIVPFKSIRRSTIDSCTNRFGLSLTAPKRGGWYSLYCTTRKQCNWSILKLHSLNRSIHLQISLQLIKGNHLTGPSWVLLLLIDTVVPLLCLLDRMRGGYLAELVYPVGASTLTSSTQFWQFHLTLHVRVEQEGSNYLCWRGRKLSSLPYHFCDTT